MKDAYDQVFNSHMVELTRRKAALQVLPTRRVRVVHATAYAIACVCVRTAGDERAA